MVPFVSLNLQSGPSGFQSRMLGGPPPSAGPLGWEPGVGLRALTPGGELL